MVLQPLVFATATRSLALRRVPSWAVLSGLLLTTWPGLSGADCNLNGVEDTAELAAGTSGDCNGNSVPDECESVSPEFGLRDEGIEFNGFPATAATGDFNGDGVTDLAAALSNSTLSVLLSRGNGTFEEAVSFDSGPGGSPRSMTVSDLDGDGDLDVATATHSLIQVLRNNGDGTFGAPRAVAVPSGTRFVTAGDLTGDGLPDLAVTHSRSDQVSVLKNLGDARFGTSLTSGVGTYPTSVAVIDLDRDRELDLAVANRDSGTISVLLNHGGGTFDQAVDYDAGPGDVFMVKGGDLDGDAASDLVVATSAHVSVLMNNGDGSFRAPVIYAWPAVSVDAGDLDGDGDLDLIAGSAASSKVLLLVNSGDGRFRGSEQASLSVVETVTTGDLDADGDLDLVVTGAGAARVSVLWNGAAGAAPLRFQSRTIAVGRPHSAAIGDVDGDGDLDVVTADGWGGNVVVVRNQDGGTFASRRNFSTGAYLLTIATGDLDADGDLDIVTADYSGGRMLALSNRADGTFGSPTSVPCGSRPIMVTTADLDSDGSVELVSANEGSNTITVAFNGGDGTFTERTDLRVGARPVAVVTADLDGDGNLDLCSSNESSRNVSILFTRSNRTFAPAVNRPVPGNPIYVTAADLDGDGWTDLATVNEDTRDITVFLNQGNGAFPEPVTFAVDQPSYSLIHADMNSDGILDLITANPFASSVSVLLGKGDGAFFPAMAYGVGDGPRFVVTGDLDQDGDMDIVAANRLSQDLTVLFNESAAPRFQEEYLERICTELEFHHLSIPARGGGLVERATKYLLPARDDPELLPTLFQNVRRFQLHQEFLEAVFPDRFPSLTVDEYQRLVERRATREYYVGVVSRLHTGSGPAYGFSVLVDTSSPAELLALEEVRHVYDVLRLSFQLEPLGYFPENHAAREAAREWADPGFPLYLDDPGEVEYQAYTQAVGFGLVRNLKEDELTEANSRGEISFQSILVLERAPRDIEGVVGGVITAEPQGELSHLALRTARRRTPNAFVRDALSAFEPFDGKLVRLEVKEVEYLVREATLEEAEEFWAANRPRLTELPDLDGEYAGLSSLAEIAAMDELSPQEPRFGGKATNLARLGRVLAASPFERFRESGFAIPVRYYLEFMRTNRMPSTVDPGRRVTYEEFLLELFALPEFQSDSTFRFQKLQGFREYARENGRVTEELIDRLVARIAEIFPSTGTAVRFRSSSNVEDALEFNGAGLYESTGACADDDLDGDALGPSRCDPSKDGERDIRRALKKVWTSLWTFRAHEERAFYGIPPEQVGMGILVSRAFLDELANGVAFTGSVANPLDKRYVVTAQLGEESVVSPDPGVRAEKDVLEVAGGRVEGILRPRRGSSMVPPGTWILSDAQLEEMGSFMAYVDANFPIDLGEYRREQVLLDLEFKVERGDGSLAFKQVRPFLLSGPVPPAPTFELEIPAGTMACGVFALAGVGRGPREEYELKSTVRFRSGTVRLPTRAETFSEDLVEEVLFGPERQVAEPLSRGRFRVTRVPGGEGRTTYRFTYEEEFSLAGGERFLLSLESPLEYRAKGEDPIGGLRRLDEEFFIVAPGNEAFLGRIAGRPPVHYGSCRYDALPRWRVLAQVEDGTSLRLEERWQPSEDGLDTGPATLARAEVVIGGERRVVSDYWDLVYSASRHNAGIHYWVAFDPAAEVEALARPVRVVELAAPGVTPQGDVTTPARVRYLDENLSPLAERAVLSFSKEPVDTELEQLFRRGDVSADGDVNLTDAVRLLEYLFGSGGRLPCEAAADADGDGILTVTDAVRILVHLFQGGEMPQPFPSCGADPVPDLPCATFPPCA